MRTRAQRRDDAAQEPQKSKSNNKKQKLQEKKKLKAPQADGDNVGKKKVKKDEEPEVKKTRRDREKSVRVNDEPVKTEPNKKVDAKQERSTRLTRRTSTVKQPSPKKLKRKSPEKAEQVKPAAKGRKEKVKQQQLAKGGKTDEDNQKEQIKKIQFKGKIPIDEFCPLDKSNYHVLEHGGKVYSATLNQTSVQNNNNKFYILQILQSDSNANSCYFYCRWGRVGVEGQKSNYGPMNIIYAVGQYNSKFHQKNKKGNYRQIQLNYGDQDEAKKCDEPTKGEVARVSNKKDQFQKSKLPTSVKKLVELIFDLNMMNKQMIQIGYNVSKMPLGKLSKDNIMKGYKILQELMDQIKGKRRKQIINQLTNDFYSYIPHDFGFMKMANFILDDEQKVKKKIQMLQALAEIKVATTILNSSKEDQNRIDSNYLRLNRDIKPVQKNTEEWKIINNYLQTTHGTTHTSYSLQLQDLFALNTESQNIRYTKDIDNKQLLWHGSRLTNFVGILSQGLRIAPPEAPVTGYMFGKGVYFADMSSKSANYCFTSRQNNTGILLLCETALGDMNEKYQADYYASNLPPGKHSTKGLGRTAPNPQNAVKLSDGVIVPMGPGESTNRVGCTLLYNQFIVYDIAQIKIRYLLRTKFNYKSGMFY